MTNQESFQLEQNELLKTILDLRFFAPWKDTKLDNGSLQHDSVLEIYITNACNQNCQYCYLVNQPGLYPSEKREPKLLLSNLHSLYQWVLDNRFNIPRCDLFSGEIWHTNFGLEVLEETLNFLKQGMHIEWFMIASNCSFVFDEKQLHKIQHYIDEFRKYGSALVFSISVEGAVLDNSSRPLNNGEQRTEEYYDRLFLFAKHNNFLFHPMVSSNNVKNWIENYNWWKNQFKKWDINLYALMMLEVRNADWTEESIQDYNSFMDYLIDDYFINECRNDIEIFSNHLLNVRNYLPKNQYGKELGGYVPWAFPAADTYLSCGAADTLTVRLGDLAICPCHRTAYNKLLYGTFEVKNGEIVDIIANNPQVAIRFIMPNVNLCSFGCDDCPFEKFCLKGCLGAQYEVMGDPFLPIPNVCEFFRAKYTHLLEKFQKMGVIKYLQTFTRYEKDYPIVKNFLKMVQQWENWKNGMEKWK